MEITRCLMGARDMLEMNMASTEYIMPAVRDCFMSMQRYPSLPASFEGMKTLENWYKKVSTMKVADTLTEEEIKQLKYDLGNIFDAFSAIVQG